MSDPFATLDATAQAQLVRTGEVRPDELVAAAIARIERLDATLGSVVHPAFDDARARAQRAPAGPFRGVPMLMKDLGGAEAGRPYTAGMRALKDAGWRAPRDAYLTQKFAAAGFVSLGRTSTPELALLPTTEPQAYGVTRNPWNPGRSPGGSSGGAAAAVAAGLVPLAHASDGGGSIRIPAAHCGLVGLKTTRGRCSFGPDLGERWSGFSVEFAVTRSVRDAAALLDAVAGPMPGDPYCVPPPERPYREALTLRPPRLRIAVMRRAPRDVPLDPACLAAVDAAARTLASLGHAVDDAWPAPLDEGESVQHYVTVVSAAIARALESWGSRLGRTLGPEDVEVLTAALAERGRRTSAAELLGAIDGVHAFGRRLAAWWDATCDLLLTPTTAAPPPEIGVLTSTPDEPFRAFLRAAPYGAFTLPFNMSGQPAISLPGRPTPDGMPLGIQLVAPYGREDLLLRVAATMEEAAPWAERRPRLHA